MTCSTPYTWMRHGFTSWWTAKKARMFPRKDMAGAPTVQHKSHIPKVMFITAYRRPDPAHNFDGMLGIWRMRVLKEAARTSKNHKKGDVYQMDVPIDVEWYRNWCTGVLLPTIKKKMPRYAGSALWFSRTERPLTRARGTRRCSQKRARM
ncbi:unnamed protein product [Discosporangium mesarthrocarpum]